MTHLNEAIARLNLWMDQTSLSRIDRLYLADIVNALLGEQEAFCEADHGFGPTLNHADSLHACANPSTLGTVFLCVDGTDNVREFADQGGGKFKHVPIAGRFRMTHNLSPDAAICLADALTKAANEAKKDRQRMEDAEPAELVVRKIYG